MCFLCVFLFIIVMYLICRYTYIIFVYLVVPSYNCCTQILLELHKQSYRYKLWGHTYIHIRKRVCAWDKLTDRRTLQTNIFLIGHEQFINNYFLHFILYIYLLELFMLFWVFDKNYNFLLLLWMQIELQKFFLENPEVLNS